MFRLSEIKNSEIPCPFCGERVLGYLHKVRCWSLTEVKCPECGAIIRNGKIYRIIDVIIIIITSIIAFAIIDHSGDIFRGTSVGVLLLPPLIYRHVAVFFSPLDYEEDAKHPKTHDK